MGIFDSYDNPVVYPSSTPTYPSIPNVTPRDPWMSKPSPRKDGDTIYWYYGDIIQLPIEIIGQIYLDESQEWVEIADFLVGRTVVVTLIDFRGDIRYEKEHTNLTTNVVDFILEEEDSKQVLKGNYTLKLAVYDVDGSLIKILVADSQYTIVVE